MSATVLNQVKRVLAVCYDDEFPEVVRDAVSYLGDGVSVERAGNLNEGARLIGHPFDVVIVVTTGYMRLEHRVALVSLVGAFSGKKSTVFVMGPRSDGQFVAEMSAADAEKVIDTDYDVATLRQVLVSVLPAPVSSG